jgi:uncharacterized phage-associated protein
MVKAKEVIQTVYYILSKIKQADKIKLVKLIYLADKYHLLLYGRTITGDRYFAMDYGPVGSMVKDVLKPDKYTLSHEDIEYSESLYKRIDDNTFRVKDPAHVENFNFSESDKRALDFIIEKFGKNDSFELSDYTHKYHEWLSHEEELKAKKCIPLSNKDLLSVLEDDIFQIPPEHIELSRRFMSGEFE